LSDFLDAKNPPRLNEALIDGSDTTMIAAAISAMESTTADVSTLGRESGKLGFASLQGKDLQTLVHACITSMVVKRTTLTDIVTAARENVAIRPQT
jgi:hypothetical protein